MKSKTTLPFCLALMSILALWAVCVVPPTHGVGEPGPADDDDDAAEGTVLEDATGTVTKVGNFGFGLVPDSDPGTRYAPTEALAEEFQQDGLRVCFSGVVGDPDESGQGGRGGRRWGTPIEVTHIEVLDEEPGSGGP